MTGEVPKSTYMRYVFFAPSKVAGPHELRETTHIISRDTLSTIGYERMPLKLKMWAVGQFTWLNRLETRIPGDVADVYYSATYQLEELRRQQKRRVANPLHSPDEPKRGRPPKRDVGVPIDRRYTIYIEILDPANARLSPDTP